MAEDEIADLERRMAKAAADQDFELAAALRDRLVQAKASLFERQVPGRMGLGTDQQTFRPPPGLESAQETRSDDQQHQAQTGRPDALMERGRALPGLGRSPSTSRENNIIDWLV